MRSKIVIASKFMPVPWKVSVKSQLAASAKASIERMGIEKIDLYQLHAPISIRSHNALADALADAHQQGLIDAVGVSNYSAKEMTAFAASLKKHGLTLASNQIEYSLLRTMPDKVGLLDSLPRARRHAAGLLAHRPGPTDRQVLGGQPAAGQAHLLRPPDGRGGRHRGHPAQHRGRPTATARPSQVALAYLIAKGAVPIPGAKNKQQAEENAGALGWEMTAEELAQLDAAALFGQRTLSQRFFQHG